MSLSNNKIEDVTNIAIVISHPIQHFCPQYVSFASNKNIRLKVFFGSKLGLEKYTDPNFKTEISWSNLNISAFEHEFLNGEKILQPDKELDAPSLNRALASFGPEIIITYGYFQKLQRRASRWAKRNNIPVAYISDSELKHERKLWKEIIKSVFLRSYFSRISYFLTVGNANEEFYTANGVHNHKMLRMHFPIDLKSYQYAWEGRDKLRQNTRSHYNIPDNAIVLAVVGKLVNWKNQDHIIEALKLLEDECVFFHLFIIGSGEMMEAFKNKAASLIKSRVYFPGFVNIEDLPAYYAATDIYVHPASMEPHSIAVSEAIYMGCPIILSNRCGSYGVDDDVQNGKNGCVYDFGNIRQLAGLINMLASNHSKRKEYGDYAHQISIKFQHSAHFGIIDDILNRVTKNRYEDNKESTL